MKKTALFLAALVASVSLTAEEAATKSYSVTADFPYTTKYVFRGVELAKGAFQPSVKLTSGAFYAGVWTSLPVDKGYEAEVDFYGGYGFKLDDVWNLDVGLTAYHYPGLDVGDKTTWEGYVGLNGTLGVITTGTYAYYDATLKAFTVQEALGYSFVINPKTSVNVAVTAGRVSPNVGSGYTYYGFGFTVPVKLTDSTTLTLGAQYADHNISGLDGKHVWATAGLTVVY